MSLVVREDLSKRTALSKSVLASFDMCPSRSWFDLRAPRPIVPNERMAFGSALDAAVEVVVKYLRAGQPADLSVAEAAASEVVERDGIAVDVGEVMVAVRRFLSDVAPGFDFTHARTQESVTAEFEGLGECNGHPDLWLASNAVFDVKSAKRAKFDEPTVELGFYALLVEAESGRACPEAGYLVWVRSAKPWWQVLRFGVTDELRRWTVEKAAAYIRAKRADEALNAKSASPQNWSFTSGPKFPSLCDDCAYNPANGGACAIARRDVTDDAA